MAEIAIKASECPTVGAGIRVDPRGNTVVLPIEYSVQAAVHVMKKFRCARCGKCETGAGWIRFNAWEIPAISEYLHARPRHIKRMLDGDFMKAPCQFWKAAGCQIYPVRPIVCRLFPVGVVDYQGGQKLTITLICDAARDLFQALGIQELCRIQVVRGK